MKDLNSSTCVTVHNFHLLLVIFSGSGTTAALSKNLQKKKRKKSSDNIATIKLIRKF